MSEVVVSKNATTEESSVVGNAAKLREAVEMCRLKTDETSADIIAEMLGARTEFPFVYLMGEPDTPEVIDPKTKEIISPRKINIRRVTVKELAHRLESARKRERGNVAQLREAVEFCVRQMSRAISDNTFGDDVVYLVGCMKACIDRMNTALAAPPRNCDVGTAEEQKDRYVRFCDSHYKNHSNCFGCAALKPRGRCEFAWAQMPYEEGGAK